MFINLPHGQQLLLTGKDFSIAVTEDQKHRVLELAIVVKDAERLECIPFRTKKIDLEKDQQFQILRVQAVGKGKRPKKKDPGGITEVDPKDPDLILEKQRNYPDDK